MATTDLIGAPERTDLPRPTAPLPPAAVSALARLEQALAPAPVDPAVRLSAVSAECRRLSAAAMTSADFDELLCVQDELAMCSCLVAAADEHGKTEPPLPVRPPRPHPHVVKRLPLLAVAFVAAAALALTGCGPSFEQGPAGTVVDKPKRLSCQLVSGRQQCVWKFRLTTRDKAGAEHTFPVTRGTYSACGKKQAYPKCAGAAS